MTGYSELLTITKECKEREYRGVVIRLPGPLARVHAASGSKWHAAFPYLAFFLSSGFGTAEQIYDSIFNRFCRSPDSLTRPCEDVTQHCNNFIISRLFIGFSEPASYIGAFCHTSVRQTVDFPARKCGARLKILKNETDILNLLVKIFGNVGGAAF